MTPDRASKGVAWEEPDQTAEPKPPKRIGFGMGQPPLTALIDVFLFLIIFFLLSCQFHQSEGTIPANLPNLGGPEGGLAPDPIRVGLSRQGDGVLIEVRQAGRKLESMAALYEHLQSQSARYGPTIPVLIQPRQGVRWGFVVDAFNQAVRAGFQKVGVAPSGASPA
jgi:biopolymer transport protein ExbD